MSKATDKSASSIAELEKHADAIRKELRVPKQSDVFRYAVEAGYLAALADGDVDATEHATIVRAVELLSVGAVIEWEAEALLAACEASAKKDGAAKRAEAVGHELKALGQAEAGLFLAAVVARATKGVDKKEAEMLKLTGAAAGLSTDQVRDIVKRASSLGG